MVGIVGGAHAIHKCRVVRVDGVLSADEVAHYREIYESILAGTYRERAEKHRYDLGSRDGSHVRKDVENITQIMWPSDIAPELLNPDVSILHTRCRAIARAAFGDDMDFDFDMLIDKRTDTPTPAHQDCAYWPFLPDKRAMSVWVALDDASVESGCMWYGPADPLTCEVRAHRRAGPADNAPLECDASETEMMAMPLTAGGCGCHSGRTLHYSRGNATGRPRRAYILNFRPRAMIDAERERGFDHGRGGHKSHEVRSAD